MADSDPPLPAHRPPVLVRLGNLQGLRDRTAARGRGHRQRAFLTAGVGCTFKCEVNLFVGGGWGLHRPGPTLS